MADVILDIGSSESAHVFESTDLYSDGKPMGVRLRGAPSYDSDSLMRKADIEGIVAGDIADHEAASDPHTGYRLESADHSHQSTGLQGGQLDHGLAMTALSLGDDDHPQYLRLAGPLALGADWDAGAARKITVGALDTGTITGTSGANKDLVLYPGDTAGVTQLLSYANHFGFSVGDTETTLAGELKTSGIIYPSGNNTIDFGKAGARFKDGYFAGDLFAGTINSATVKSSTAAVTLKDSSDNTLAEIGNSYAYFYKPIRPTPTATHDLGDASYAFGDMYSAKSLYITNAVAGDGGIFIDKTDASDKDPILQFKLSGTAKFTLGVDDSDSDKFKIHSGSALSTTPAITVDASSNVIVGYTASIEWPILEVAGGSGGIGLHRFSTSQYGSATIFLSHSKSGTTGSHTVVAANDDLGDILFRGSDGTNFESAARIGCQVDTAPGNDDMPGRLMFYTSADGGKTPLEAMRITCAQDVGIGATAPDAKLEIQCGSTYGKQAVTIDQDDADQAFIDFQGSSGAGTSYNVNTTERNTFAAMIMIEVNGTQRWLKAYS